MNKEKRRYQRYPNVSLQLSFARPGIRGIFSANPSAACSNFSRTGLQFDCATDLPQGEKLLMDVELGDIGLQELKAEIVSKQPAESGDWCYGVRFCLEETRKSDVFHALLLIEDRIKAQTAV